MFVKKGLLYAKIDLSCIGGSNLHIFNTHTQATECNLSVDLHVNSYVSRYEQIKEINRTIKSIVFDNSRGFDRQRDLVILAGDFN